MTRRIERREGGGAVGLRLVGGVLAGLGGPDRLPHRVGADRGGGAHAEHVDHRQREGDRVQAEELDLRHGEGEDRQREHQAQEGGLEDIGEIGGGMFEIDPAIGEIGDGEKGGLGGDAADAVGEGERGAAIGGGGDRDHDAGKRGGGAKEHTADQRLAEAAAVGEAVRGAGEQHAAEGDEGRRGGENAQKGGQREAGEAHGSASPARWSGSRKVSVR